MKTILIFLISYSLYSQVTQQWVSYYNGPGPSGLASDIAIASVSDAQGNTYVTGRSANSDFSSFDIATVKYNSEGVQQWSMRYAGSQNRNDQGQAITADGSGNIYVTGYSETNSGGSQMITIKYNPAGVQQWVVLYTPPYSSAVGNSITTDLLNNVYVTGWSDTLAGTGFRQYTTIKYNSAGVQQWIKKYSLNNWDAEAVMIKLDQNANVYVTGKSFAQGSSQWDFATIKYNTGGDLQWISRYTSSPGVTDDEAAALCVDGSGNVYVTGKGSYSSGSPFDYVTIKYNSSGGEMWVTRYNGTGNQSDAATCIAADISGNIYTGGSSFGGPSEGNDFAVIKYNSAGIQQWANRYNFSNNDQIYSLKLDDSSNVYIAGFDGAYKTIKYNSAGIEKWNARFSSNSTISDYFPLLSIDGLNNVIISGSSILSPQNSYDYTVIKYSQITGIHTVNAEIPKEFSLLQNYPNPFNPSTKIRFSIVEASNTKIILFNSAGQLVLTLAESFLKPGNYELDWNGSWLASGTYYYRLTSGKYSETRKMILLK